MRLLTSSKVTIRGTSSLYNAVGWIGIGYLITSNLVSTVINLFDPWRADNAPDVLVPIALASCVNFRLHLFLYWMWICTALTPEAVQDTNSNSILLEEHPNPRGPNPHGPNPSGPNSNGHNSSDANSNGPNSSGLNSSGPNARYRNSIGISGASAREINSEKSPLLNIGNSSFD